MHKSGFHLLEMFGLCHVTSIQFLEDVISYNLRKVFGIFSSCGNDWLIKQKLHCIELNTLDLFPFLLSVEKLEFQNERGRIDFCGLPYEELLGFGLKKTIQAICSNFVIICWEMTSTNTSVFAVAF